MTTRRELLGQSIAAALVASMETGAAAPLAADDAGWFDRPMRWAQLNSDRRRSGQDGCRFWLDYFKRIHADAACLTAGGVVAFYPDQSSAFTTAASGWPTTNLSMRIWWKAAAS